MGVDQLSSAVHTHLMPKCLQRQRSGGQYICTSGKLHAAEDDRDHHVMQNTVHLEYKTTTNALISLRYDEVCENPR